MNTVNLHSKVRYQLSHIMRMLYDEKEIRNTSRKEEIMTQLQLAYQTLLETKRANAVNERIKQQEANIKQGQLAVSQGELAVKKQTATAQLADLFADANLKNAQLGQVAVNIDKILADTDLSKAYIDQINADILRIASQTSLNEAQAAKVLNEVAKVIADTKLTDAQRIKVVQETMNLLVASDKMKAEIKKIDADTKLSDAQKQKAIADTSLVPYEKAEKVSKTVSNYSNVLKMIWDMTLGSWSQNAGTAAKLLLLS